MTAMDEGQQNAGPPDCPECVEYEVIDDDRKLHFHGIELGSASSKKPGKNRWFEVTIYKTRAGQYIVAGIGRTMIQGEVDKHWAQVCERPEGVIEKLHMLDDDGSKYLPYVSKRALRQARENDTVFADAYLVEDIA